MTIAKTSVPGGISPAAFPRIILVALIVCALLQIFRGKDDTARFPSPGRTLSGIALVGLYIGLIDLVGYFILTPIFLMSFPLLLGYRRWRWIIALALGCTLLFYLVFNLLLGVPLPAGFLENMGA
jgi:putative tricarboxylic transport membrane protein